MIFKVILAIIIIIATLVGIIALLYYVAFKRTPITVNYNLINGRNSATKGVVTKRKFTSKKEFVDYVDYKTGSDYTRTATYSYTYEVNGVQYNGTDTVDERFMINTYCSKYLDDEETRKMDALYSTRIIGKHIRKVFSFIFGLAENSNQMHVTIAKGDEIVVIYNSEDFSQSRIYVSHLSH